MKKVILLSITLVIVVGLVIAAFSVKGALGAPEDSTYYSNSVFLDGTYDIGYIHYAWKPVDLPGYQIDTSRGSCVGYMRIDNDYFACTENDGSWTFDDYNDRWYFLNDNIPATLCGDFAVDMQPWLYVYNPITGQHDVIYGNILTVDWGWCRDTKLPLILQEEGSKTYNPYP